MLVLETSPGTEQAIGLIQLRAFQEAGGAGAIGLGRTAQVPQPLTDNRDQLAARYGGPACESASQWVEYSSTRT